MNFGYEVAAAQKLLAFLFALVAAGLIALAACTDVLKSDSTVNEDGAKKNTSEACAFGGIEAPSDPREVIMSAKPYLLKAGLSSFAPQNLQEAADDLADEFENDVIPGGALIEVCATPTRITSAVKVWSPS